MAKKPKHDPATAWKKPDPVNTSGFASGPTKDQILQAYARITMPTPTNWVQQMVNQTYLPITGGGVTPSYSQQQLLAAQYMTQFLPAPTSLAAPNKIRWADVQVGETVAAESLGTIDLAPTDISPDPTGLSYIVAYADGSEGRYSYGLGSVTKTKAAFPTATPEDIEETTEVLTGWRVFTVCDYKLRGTWSTWEGRVFHASCNCKEFEERNWTTVTEFKLLAERRDDLRRHLAAGTGTCGVYSRKTLEPDNYVTSPRPGEPITVAARCVNYGLGYEYSDGYRSEYSRLEHLWVLAKGSLYELPHPFAANRPTLSHATETHADGISPATAAQVLSTTYGVPCEVMTPLEFAYKSEAGLL